MSGDDPDERARVRERIGAAIVSFLRPRIGHTFYCDQLRAYVQRKVAKLAPGSADRILRMMRQDQEIDYEVVDRSKSLYRVLRVGSDGLTEDLFR